MDRSCNGYRRHARVRSAMAAWCVVQQRVGSLVDTRELEYNCTVDQNSRGAKPWRVLTEEKVQRLKKRRDSDWNTDKRTKNKRKRETNTEDSDISIRNTHR